MTLVDVVEMIDKSDVECLDIGMIAASTKQHKLTSTMNRGTFTSYPFTPRVIDREYTL